MLFHAKSLAEGQIHSYLSNLGFLLSSATLSTFSLCNLLKGKYFKNLSNTEKNTEWPRRSRCSWKILTKETPTTLPKTRKCKVAFFITKLQDQTIFPFRAALTTLNRSSRQRFFHISCNLNLLTVDAKNGTRDLWHHNMSSSTELWYPPYLALGTWKIWICLEGSTKSSICKDNSHSCTLQYAHVCKVTYTELYKWS